MNDLKEILKSIGGELRKAQNLMFSRKFEDASEMVSTLNILLEDAMALEPGNVQVKTYSNQIAKLQKDLNQRMGKSAPAAQATPAASESLSSPADGTPLKPAPARSVAPMTPAQKPAPGLPAGVQKRIRDMNDLIRRGKPQDALGLLKEIHSQYGGQFDEAHPDFVEAKQKAEAAQLEIERKQQTAQADKERSDRERVERERASQEWEQRLKLIKPFCVTTSAIPDLLAQQQIFEEAQNVFSEFRTVEFPYGKTYGLEQVEKKIGSDIEAFPAFWDNARKQAFEEAMAHIASRRSELDKIIEDKPLFMSDGSIRQTEAFLARVQPLFPENSDEDTTIKAALKGLLEKNRMNKQERAKLIFMREDQYVADDAEAIKERMVRFVLDADPEAQIVQTSVYKPEWRELSQWEDYAGNKRFVTRREINGQVVARIKGRPLLFTIYITKERQSDGTWTQLTGNVMFTDEMAEENAEKRA